MGATDPFKELITTIDTFSSLRKTSRVPYVLLSSEWLIDYFSLIIQTETNRKQVTVEMGRLIS